MNIDTDLIYDDKESEKRRIERKKRREARRKRSTGRRKVLSFLWGAKELLPIINLSPSNDNGSIDYESIAQKVKSQESLLNEIIDGIGDISYGSENFQLRAGIASSQLVSNHDNINSDALSKCLSLLSQSNDNKSDLIEQLDMGVFSSDVLVNIKVQMLPGLYDFYSSLRTLTNDKNIIEEYTSWLSNVSTDLAKDVAFNWDKKSSYRDRETLFICMLPTCVEIGISAFYEYLSKYNGAARIISKSACFDIRFPILHEAINELDMGYLNHPNRGLAWLEDHLNTILFEAIPYLIIPKCQEMHYNRIMGSILSDIDNIAAESWKKESSSFIEKIQDEISGLGDKEIEVLMAEKYNEPMSLNGFSSRLMAHIDRWPGIISPIDTNLSEISNIAEQKMAALWGLTEAVCQIRSDKHE